MSKPFKIFITIFIILLPIVFSQSADDDKDGIEDELELKCGLDPDVFGDGNEDYDSDGLINKIECSIKPPLTTQPPATIESTSDPGPDVVLAILIGGYCS